MRPKTIIIHDNLLKKIYFIINCFADEKIINYQKYYFKQIQNIQSLINLAFNYEYGNVIKAFRKKNFKVKSNISKSEFKKNG